MQKLLSFRFFSRVAIAVLTISILTLFSQRIHAEGELREKLKERLKERWLKRQENKRAQPDDANPNAKISQPGDYQFSIQHEGLTRMYRIHVPSQYDPATPTPLILAFHGGGGSMDYMAKDKYYGLISKSEKEGFVVVFPNGFSKLKSGKFATWNAGRCCAGARDENIDDVGFVKVVIEEVMNQLNIDHSKIFATGMSNGGMMSYRLACEMSDTFKAIASIAGTENIDQCGPSQPISILHIHAQNDTHVLFHGGAGKDAFKDQTKVTDFTAVPETISRWVKRNHCDPTPQRVLEKEGVYCDLYSHCDGNVEVKLCVTSSGGHSWPGGFKLRGDEAPSTAISANDEIWNFVKDK
jgi:polyhydroxybutyrate depolymerase